MLRFLNSFTGEKMEDEDPEWLAPLQEQSPLLSDSQYDFISSVCSTVKHNSSGWAKLIPSLRRVWPGPRGNTIMHKAQSVNGASEDRVREIVHIAETLKNNFELVVEKLHMNSSSRQRFLQHFPRWRQVRDMNVSHLKKIANTADEHKQNCQASKAIGSLISLIGGGICLASDNGNHQTSQMIGSALMGIGTLTTAGTSAAEEMLLRDNVDKAKKIMQRDQECMEYLQDWLDDASCLQKAMTNIRSIACDEFQTAADKLQTISEENLSPRQVEKEILNVLKSLDLPEELRKEVSDIIGILTTVTMLFDRFRPFFNLALKSYNVMHKLRLSADLFRAAYIGVNSVSTLSNCGAQMTSDQKRRVAKGMALDAINILHVSLEDPNSVEGREIRRVAAELEKEAIQLQNLYGSMKTLNISRDWGHF